MRTRTYMRDDVMAFRFTRGPGGFFSNFYPAKISVATESGDVIIGDTETLYNAMKFTDAESQIRVLSAESPKAAKAAAYEISGIRDGWEEERVDVMRFCVSVKFSQHRDLALSEIAKANGREIVEHSARDDFWGAVPQPDGTLRGRNVLGNMCAEIGKLIAPDGGMGIIQPPSMRKGAFLLGHLIVPQIPPEPEQLSLF